MKITKIKIINYPLSIKRKPSGIAWLGDIPEHWEVKKLKHIVNAIIDTEHKTVPFFDDEKYFVVRTSDIRNGVLLIEKMRRTNREGFEEWTKRETPVEGDIIFTREAPAGEACVVPKNLDVCLGQRTVLFKTNQELAFSELIVHLIYSDVVKEYINQLSQGSTVTHFNMADIKNIPLILPPIEEQKQIVEFIETATGKIDATIATIEKEIGFLREYRTALISEVVTGKIKVIDNG